MWIYKSALSPNSFAARGSAYTEKYLSELKDECNKLKKTPVPPLTDELFYEFTKTGRRIGYEKPYFLRRMMLRDFALMAWLGDTGAAEYLENIINAICLEKTWALPAHDADAKGTIDLFAAETAQSLTEIISLLNDSLNAKICEKALREVRRRVLDPFLSRREKYAWESMDNNWCAVCGGSVGITAAYLTEDTSEFKRISSHLEPVFESYMKSFTSDGACLEGLYYWGYGMMYLTAFLELYTERTGEEFPINTAMLKKMALFPQCACMTDGVTASFSDGGEHDRIYAGLASKLGEHFGIETVSEEYIAPFSGDECGRWLRASRDIAWGGETRQTTPAIISCLNKAQWAIIRGDNVSLSFKGGTNGEPHNHNDIGSFTVVKNGSAVLCDLGAGEYTREYFSEKRYNILCAASLGHSVPIIDGRGQMAGKSYSAEDFQAEENSVCADISGAYGNKKLKKCVRSIALNGGEVKLSDTYSISGEIAVTERFVTRLDAREDGSDVILIRSGEEIARIKCEINAKISHFTHREHNGSETEITLIDYTFSAGDGESFILTII